MWEIWGEHVQNIIRLLWVVTALIPVHLATAQNSNQTIAMQVNPLATEIPGKALYFSTFLSQRRESIWLYNGTQQYPGYKDVQSSHLVRKIGRLILIRLLNKPSNDNVAVLLSNIFDKEVGTLPQGDYGFINETAKKNPSANFIEHFHAYVTAQDSFKEKAKRQGKVGRQELLEKFLFLQVMFESSPFDTQITQSTRVSNIDKKQYRPALDMYLAQQTQSKENQMEVENIFGKPFSEFTNEEYAIFLKELNLDRDEDILLWSNITGIPILALRKSSHFFRMNLHLMEDANVAEKLKYKVSSEYKTLYDEKTGNIELYDELGAQQELRNLPNYLFTPASRYNGFWHYPGFIDREINYEVVEPYLLRLKDLPYRDSLGKWITMIPLNIVKTYRGKAIYFTSVPGRSFSTSLPVSNTIYKLHAGLKTGVWIEMRSDGIKGTEMNFIHEIGHIIDHMVIRGGYGGYRHIYQFPEFRKLLELKNAIFGERDSNVSSTPYGYISRYATKNAQENFAEHFRAIIVERKKFKESAEKEEKQGHPELMQKYLFMKNMMENTSPRMVPLTKAFLEKEARENQAR